MAGIAYKSPVATTIVGGSTVLPLKHSVSANRNVVTLTSHMLIITGSGELLTDETEKLGGVASVKGQVYELSNRTLNVGDAVVESP